MYMMNLSISRPFIRLVRDVIVPYQWEVLNEQVEGAEPQLAT